MLDDQTLLATGGLWIVEDIRYGLHFYLLLHADRGVGRRGGEISFDQSLGNSII